MVTARYVNLVFKRSLLRVLAFFNSFNIKKQQYQNICPKAADFIQAAVYMKVDKNSKNGCNNIFKGGIIILT